MTEKSAETHADAPKAEITSWVPPTGDQEFVFDGTMGSLPAWADPTWQSHDGYSIALAVPSFIIPTTPGPHSAAYSTNIAHKGDTVKWVEATRTFTIVPAPPPPPEQQRTVEEQVGLKSPAPAKAADDDDDDEDDKKAAKKGAKRY